jgi:tetratricopeptide (TPR) repeat protein
MALQWSGLEVTPDSLADEVYTPSRKGSLQMAMIGGARRNGRIAYVISHFDTLFLELAAGHPVIILQNLGLSWYPQWHYAVAVGYDFHEDVVFLRSGRIERLAMALGTFEKTWSRSDFWGLLVLRPNVTPAVIQEAPYLKAVLGLEKARQYEAAEEGYETALTLWPRNLGGLMGLGNSRYALGNLEGAEEAFRVAVRYHSDHGAPYNNLAQVLFEQGRLEEALEAAKKAVSLGGAMKEVYEKTLEEIESK